MFYVKSYTDNRVIKAIECDYYLTEKGTHTFYKKVYKTELRGVFRKREKSVRKDDRVVAEFGTQKVWV
jgi:hypothetical protein